MLQKSERLTKAAFDTSFKRGKRFHSPLLQLIHDSTTKEFHGAAVVGKKVSKKAVGRNRLRRQLYGALYRYSRTTPLFGTYILIAKPASKTVTAGELTETVQALLARTTQKPGQ